jgi:starvation-inducible DNA-binding protein
VDSARRERIRALGHQAPFGGSIYRDLASIPETQGVPPALEMVRELVQGHEAVARTIRSVFSIADEANDQPTADLLTQRLQIHEKTAWMLRSLLES